ncbi:hypothetical protein FE66_15185, partial [Staphylococcus aureus]
ILFFPEILPDRTDSEGNVIPLVRPAASPKINQATYFAIFHKDAAVSQVAVGKDKFLFGLFRL